MDSKQMAFAAFTGEEVAAGDNSKAFVLVQQFIQKVTSRVYMLR